MEGLKLVGQLGDDVVQIRRKVGILIHDAGERLLEGLHVDLLVRDHLHAIRLSLDVRFVGILTGLVSQLLLNLSEGIQNDLLILFRQRSQGIVVHHEEYALERMTGIGEKLREYNQTLS